MWLVLPPPAAHHCPPRPGHALCAAPERGPRQTPRQTPGVMERSLPGSETPKRQSCPGTGWALRGYRAVQLISWLSRCGPEWVWGLPEAHGIRDDPRARSRLLVPAPHFLAWTPTAACISASLPISEIKMTTVTTATTVYYAQTVSRCFKRLTL